MAMGGRRRQRQSLSGGFSLIEVLVVLIIVAMVSTLAIEGGGNMMIMKQRLLSAQAKNIRQSLVNDWFRDSVLAMYPLPEHKPEFTRLHLRYTTTQPIFGEAGQPTQVVWRLAAEGVYVVLYYQQQGQEEVVMRRWYNAEGFFEVQLKAEDDWLPEVITLNMSSGSGDYTTFEQILAAYSGPLKPLPDFRVLD